MDDGRSMRVMETTPTAPLNAETGKELSSSLLWPVSLVPHVLCVTVHKCAHDIEVRPSSPTADEFHPNAKKRNVLVLSLQLNHSRGPVLFATQIATAVALT